MSNVIGATWLKENLNKQNLVIVDCRFDLMDKDYGKNAYDNEHIKDAVRIDLETQLSTYVREHGGRHPIPSTDELKDTFESVGISNESTVVAYDDGDLAGACRLWWILKYLGHEEVYVLNGGINEFKKINGEVSKDKTVIKKGKFEINVNENKKVDMFYVKEIVNKDNVAIIDSREYLRYKGEFEPVDKKAGHIPGALNYFWMDILDIKDKTITLKSIDKLKAHFTKLENYDEVIVYCGSGITACPNSLALSEIGINHKVYTGSFSDWISYDDNIVQIS